MGPRSCSGVVLVGVAPSSKARGGRPAQQNHQMQTLRKEGLHTARVLFEALPRLPTAQGGLVLLRSCGVPKFSYFLRVTPPSAGAAVGSEFDQALASSFSDLTRVALTELTEHRRDAQHCLGTGTAPRATRRIWAALPARPCAARLSWLPRTVLSTTEASIPESAAQD